MKHSTHPPLQKFTDSIYMRSEEWPCARYRREPGTTITHWAIEFRNMSFIFPAHFKLMHSNVPDGSQDNMAMVSVVVDVDPDTSPNAVMWTHEFGAFNATFEDIPDTEVTIVPGGMVGVSFSTLRPFVQVQPLTANGARVHLTASTSTSITIWSHEEVHPAEGETNTGSFVLQSNQSDA